MLPNRSKYELACPRGLFIGNAFVRPQLRGTLPVINPYTEKLVCTSPAATAADVERAVEAAVAALESGQCRS